MFETLICSILKFQRCKRESRWFFINFIQNECSEKPWDWRRISQNHPNISMETIKNNPDLPWDWWWISYNENQV